MCKSPHDQLLRLLPEADVTDAVRAGESYMVFGGASVGSGGTIELDTLTGTGGFVLNGIDPSDQSGGSVSGDYKSCCESQQ